MRQRKWAVLGAGLPGDEDKGWVILSLPARQSAPADGGNTIAALTTACLPS